MVDKQHVKEGHTHLRPPQPARLGNDHRCACSRQIDTPPIGPKHAQISLQHKAHEHIALTSIEQQVILFGNSSFVNRVVACARQRSNVSRADPSTQGTYPCLGESVYLDEDTYNHALEVHGTVQCLEPQIKTYDEKNILKKEKDQLLETPHTKMIGSIAADSNAEMNRVNAELYPDGSRKVCP